MPDETIYPHFPSTFKEIYMISSSASNIINLATANPTFRAAFRAKPEQALALFGLANTGLGADEIDAIQSIKDNEFSAFGRLTQASGISANAGVTARGASYAYL
jgi:hypothetical protein